jgi:hypothetical protein
MLSREPLPPLVPAEGEAVEFRCTYIPEKTGIQEVPEITEYRHRGMTKLMNGLGCAPMKKHFVNRNLFCSTVAGPYISGGGRAKTL